MTSAAGAAASVSTVGQRSSQRCQRGTTRSTCVCCDMTSLTRIAYGSRVFRQGRSRPCSVNQASSRSSTARTYRAGIILRMRRLLVVVGVLILLAAAIGAAYYESTHRFGGSVRGTSTEFVATQTVAAPSVGSILSPMFGGEPQHLHVGIGNVRPPFRLDWVTGGTSLIEFPPAIAFHYLYYASLNGDLIAVSTRNGLRLWTVHEHRCEAASPAVDLLSRGSVFETFLNRQPCGRNAARRGDGELLVVAAGPSHKVRWRKHLGASETSPLIVGSQVYVGDAQGTVYGLRGVDGKTVWTFHAGGAVKGALAYDRGRV